jgi:hypothetical protein
MNVHGHIIFNVLVNQFCGQKLDFLQIEYSTVQQLELTLRYTFSEYQYRTVVLCTPSSISFVTNNTPTTRERENVEERPGDLGIRGQGCRTGILRRSRSTSPTHPPAEDSRPRSRGAGEAEENSRGRTERAPRRGPPSTVFRQSETSNRLTEAVQSPGRTLTGISPAEPHSVLAHLYYSYSS